MPDTTFIYALCDPDIRHVRYIGKSNRPQKRLATHLADRARCHRTNWIKSLKTENKIPVLEILDEVPTVEWEFWEKEYIRVFRAIGHDLVNQTDGGAGSPAMAGERHWSRKISKEEHPRRGKKSSEEAIEKIRRAKLGVPWNTNASLARHKVGPRSDSQSGYKGVSWNRPMRKWEAIIQVEGAALRLGHFSNVVAAARARDAAVRKYHPPGSYLNFPNE